MAHVNLRCFARKWLLDLPWANLARILRDRSPVWVFGCACCRAPFSYSFSFMWLPGATRWTLIHVCVCVRLLIRKHIFLHLPTYIHIVIISICMPVFFTRRHGLQGQLWTWSYTYTNGLRNRISPKQLYDVGGSLKITICPQLCVCVCVCVCFLSQKTEVLNHCIVGQIFGQTYARKWQWID